MKNTVGGTVNTGGAISVDQPWGMAALPAVGPMIIRNCTFQGNVGYRGGAVSSSISRGNFTIDGCLFEDNVAYATGTLGSGSGGALAIRTRFGDRPFQGAGGDSGADADFELHPSYFVTNCIFARNSASVLPGSKVEATTFGGAVALWHGGYRVWVLNCTFTDNTAVRGGAFWYSGASMVNIRFLDSLGFVGPAGNLLSASSDVNPAAGILDYFFPSSSDDYSSLAPLSNVSDYRVVVADSVFAGNTAAPTPTSGRALGGALYVECGDAVMLRCTVQNNIAQPNYAISLGSSGGAVFVTNVCDTSDFRAYLATNVTLVDTVFENNTAATRGGTVSAENAADAVPGERVMLLSLLRSVVSNSSSSSSQLLGGALFMNDNVVARLQGTTLTGCSAALGGGVYASGSTVQLLSAALSGNSATAAGGSVYLQGTADLTSTGSSYAQNKAYNGSVFATADTATLVSSSDTFLSNAAMDYGGVLYHDSAGTAYLGSSSRRANMASVGAMVYVSDASQAPALASMIGAIGDGEATPSNYGSGVATLPVAFQVAVASANMSVLASNLSTWPQLTVRSGAPLNISLTMYDALGSRVSYWQDFTLDVTCTNIAAGGVPSTLCHSTTLRGGVHAIYVKGAAELPTAAVFGSIGAVVNLTLTLGAPSLPALSVSRSLSLIIAPCAADTEVFDANAQQCICAAGFYSGAALTTCLPCRPGTVADHPGSSVCEPCPPGSVAANASMCVPCPSDSVAVQNSCACGPGFYDIDFGKSSVSPVCARCPRGGACTTGTIGAAEGYWRPSVLRAELLPCRAGNCLAENVTGPLNGASPISGAGNRRSVLAAVQQLADVPSDNCAPGNTGPFCAVCLPGYALQSGECAPCRERDAWANWSRGAKAGTLVACIIFAIVFITLAFLQPVLPGLERKVDDLTARAMETGQRMQERATACFHSCCSCCVRAVEKDPPPKPEQAIDAAPPPRRSESLLCAAPAAPAHAEAEAKPHPLHHHKTRKLDVAAVERSLAANAAFAVGNVAAFMSDIDGGVEEDDTGEEVSGVERHTDAMDRLEELMIQLKGYSKILVKCVLSLLLPYAGVLT